MFGVTVPTIRVWIAEGRLAAHKPGKSFRIPRADALALMQQTRDPGDRRDVWERPPSALRPHQTPDAPSEMWSGEPGPIATLRRRTP